MANNSTLDRSPPTRPYQAILIRCWDESGQWRCVLETIGLADRRRGFSSVAALLAYVQALLDEAGGTPAP
jgi:hypothetical protein